MTDPRRPEPEGKGAAVPPMVARRLTLLVVLLLGVELLDEAYSGVPIIGSADIQEGFEASYTATASALLLVPGIIAALVEPVLFLLADRYPRKWFVCGGLAAMSLAAFLAAMASNVYVLSAAITLAWIGSGSGVALSQATLIDSAPEDRERMMTRWALLGEVGDLIGPMLMAAVAMVSASWRAAFMVVGALVGLWAVALWTMPFAALVPQTDDDEEEEEPGLLEAFRAALANRRLLFWLGATALCDLLDEIVVVFAALYLRDDLGADAVERSAVFGAAVLGAIVGVIITHRLLASMRPLRLLLWASLGCIATYAAWLVVPNVWLSALLFFLVGVTAAPMYPIASAQAYAALPGKSGTVNAAGHVFSPIVLALPWLLGLLADAKGARVALWVLMVQPVGLAIAAVLGSRFTTGDGPDAPGPVVSMDGEGGAGRSGD